MHRRLLLLAIAATPLARSGDTREIAVVARRFRFEPDTIRIAAGQTVLLRLNAPEVPMGFSVPELGVRADIVPGREAQLRIVAPKAGSYAFLCDVFCGNGHEQMSGTLEVS